MRHWKIVSLLAFALFAILTAQYASAQENTTSKVASTDAPLKVGGDVLPPKLISTVEPKYPRPLFHKPEPSNVLVSLTVPVSGIPTDIRIVKSGGATFDKSALNAVQQYRFQPSTLHGKPVPVAINVEVQFKIF
jgi:protein TonB